MNTQSSHKEDQPYVSQTWFLINQLITLNHFEKKCKEKMAKFTDSSFLNENILWCLSFKLNIFGWWTVDEDKTIHFRMQLGLNHQHHFLTDFINKTTSIKNGYHQPCMSTFWVIFGGTQTMPHSTLLSTACEANKIYGQPHLIVLHCFISARQNETVLQKQVRRTPQSEHCMMNRHKRLMLS